MNYQRANEMLTGRCKDSRKLGNNTRLERRDDGIAVRLHTTDVVTYKPNGDVVLDSGGWRTVTTKARMNEYAPVSVWSVNGEWFAARGVTCGRAEAHLFADGITFHADGMVSGAGEDTVNVAKLDRRIADYCKGYIRRC